jgi:hypothetical protein
VFELDNVNDEVHGSNARNAVAVTVANMLIATFIPIFIFKALFARGRFLEVLDGQSESELQL